MKKIIKNEKSCKNCRYFLQHYIKDNIRYSKIFCGHCINPNFKNSRKPRPLEICELWEDIAIKKEERKTSIKETLNFMSKSLNEIAQILKDDIE